MEWKRCQRCGKPVRITLSSGGESVELCEMCWERAVRTITQQDKATRKAYVRRNRR